MAFDASKTVSALEWNFRPYIDASGTTPEPSDQMVRHFIYETQQLLTALPNTGDEDFLEKFENMTEADYAAVADRVVDLVAEVCDGCPSRDQVADLPHRIQRAYIAWLRKELTDPEAPSDATKPSRGRLMSVAPSTSSGGTSGSR